MIAVAALMLPGSTTAWAVSDIPFAITGAANATVACRGPGFILPRVSGRHSFQANRRLIFYSADINVFSPFGPWTCSVDVFNGAEEIPDNKANGTFCLELNRRSVELTWDGGASLTADQPQTCPSTLVSSVLGQNGEADKTPAQDIDTFTFAAKGDERVTLTLDRDGARGGTGTTATVRVRAKSGGVVGERRGAVPIRFAMTLPGPVEIEVARSAARPSEDSFRGYYQLQITAASGDLGGRLLIPANNVEQ